MNKLLLLVLALSLSSFVNAAKSNMLLSDESNTVEIFKKSSAKIVYVHRAKNLRHAQIRVGSGSGIIWDKDGHIITNYHVIKGADAVSITMDGITIPAKIMGVEPRKDLAVLALDSKRALSLLKSYKPFVIADSNKLLIGQ